MLAITNISTGFVINLRWWDSSKGKDKGVLVLD
jgi:hypothetical protein